MGPVDLREGPDRVSFLVGHEPSKGKGFLTGHGELPPGEKSLWAPMRAKPLPQKCTEGRPLGKEFCEK